MEIWYTEGLEISKGRKVSYRVTKTLDSIQTPFQKIDVFETESFGRMFTLDDVTMVTERDEHSYHEMIAHIPMMSHPNPENVLVIGGGDGGTVREVLKHPSVKEVVLCEIDKGVVDACYKYFPEIAEAMKDKKVIHHYDDGAKFARENKGRFDVILVDSSDPVGPAEVLFKEPFYRDMAGALRETGVIATQAESYWYHGDVIKSLFEFIPKIFPQYGYYYTTIPTYPSGIIGFTFLSNKINPYEVVPDPSRVPKNLKYYSPEIHKAAFVLPEFAKQYIKRS
ncbi:polyamine aminopropyltransferase [Leptospira sp. GIMC2001]|uniref:polyamine aminopropyltransferase n=1 Tax=Leptospira sp. GIMC2001 TaxID=1513297 RepID=UPI002349DD8E|nr:polyamine aminopropyltransferase [Leptospira sp. GIMC2001]WCL47759.1 polyamine aminopropyltransferase [Leptospira sp. GIMC2001]